ncbi:L-lactate permease [Bacillus smithii]|uniref:L-lactate permease n=1 Tax=Bacillus smithii TaxID=1479 RepID=UPI002E213ECA|nr:L-lactate permease [Bacillus smithii]
MSIQNFFFTFFLIKKQTFKKGCVDTMQLFFNFILSVSPILLALVCLIWLKISGMHTAIYSYLLAVIISLLPFHFETSLKDLLHSSIQGLLISITVIYVLIFGLLLYNVLSESRAINIISNRLSVFCRSPVEQGLLISSALGPFLEATSGFGIGIVIAAPLYLSLGFQPRKAALLSLLTQSAVPWGALAIGTVINTELSSVPLNELGKYSALVSIPLYFFYTVMVVIISGGKRAIKNYFLEILIVSTTLSLTTWLISAYVSTELAGVLAGFTSPLCLITYWKLKELIYKKFAKEVAVSKSTLLTNKRDFLKAIIPYLILTTYIFISHFYSSLKLILTNVMVVRLPKYNFHLELLYSPGFALFLASIVTIGIYRLKMFQIKSCIIRTTQQVYPASMATIGFVAMSSVMQQSGMTDFIATNVATLLGSWFIIASPIIGAIGGFMSGSNSASNAMFSHFQSTMANKLHSSELLYATSQNVSASNMTMASPSRVALVASITKNSGNEGQLVRDILPISLTAMLIIIIFILCLNFFT